MDFLILNKFSPIIEYFYSLFRPFGEAGFEDLQHSTLGLFGTNTNKRKNVAHLDYFCFYILSIFNCEHENIVNEGRLKKDHKKLGGHVWPELKRNILIVLWLFSIGI
jgi:hypothetical protein